MLKLNLLLLLLYITQIASLEEAKKDLFDSTQLKYMKLKNRVFKAAMVDCGSWENGKLAEKLLKRYEELSKNEVGTIITGTILVDSVEGYEPMCRIDKDEYIEEYKKLTERVCIIIVTIHSKIKEIIIIISIILYKIKIILIIIHIIICYRC